MTNNKCISFKNPETRKKAEKTRKKQSLEKRKEIARKAGLAKGKKGLKIASHVGELKIGEIKIKCAVVDGKRLISQNALFHTFGGKRGVVDHKVKTFILEKKLTQEGGAKFPTFLGYKNFISLIDQDLCEKMRGCEFLWASTLSKTYGYDASILPKICNLIITARNHGLLTEKQLNMARISEVLLMGLAEVGITALVDEVTGFQEFRDRDELTKILDKYISKELQPWTKKFHPEFFKEIYRLHGWKWGEWSNHPQCVGSFINRFIYEKMPPGVLDELRNKNPSDDEGKREHLHHQFLTPVGNESLGKHLSIVSTLMRMARNKGEFNHLFERAFPGKQIIMDI